MHGTQPSKNIFWLNVSLLPFAKPSRIFNARGEMFRFLKKRNFREWPVPTPKLPFGLHRLKGRIRLKPVTGVKPLTFFVRP